LDVQRRRRQRQATTLRKCEITRVIGRQREAFGKAQRRGPNVAVGVGIHGDRHEGEFVERGVAVNGVDALAPDRDLKGVGDFEALQPRHDGAAFGDTLEQFVGRQRALVLEIPGMVSEASITQLNAAPR
jgi:hypothetical protein